MYIGMKWALFDIESTTIMMALYLENLGSSITKSILRVFHQVSGTGMEWSSLAGGFLKSFMQRQRS